MTDPARSNEELFTVELLIERMRPWQHWPFHNRTVGFEERLKICRERRFNPGYRPLLPFDELEALQARAETVTHFNDHGPSDRPLRDLTALQFFPALENINISGGNVHDFSPLRDLEKLNWLTLIESSDLAGGHMTDFAQLGEKPLLDHVFLSLRQAWPDLKAIGNWPAMRTFLYSGNLLSLLEIGTLPAAVIVKMNSWVHSGTPLRDLRATPTIPKLKRLDLSPTASLAGIERYPSVVNLELGGGFTDLSPLEAMANVTFLKLTSEHFSDLTPLTRLPKLREVVFVRERPIDLSPLTDAPQLRRVDFERCTTMRMELAALNAGLLPEANDFLADTPRPLGPLPFYLIAKENKAAQDYLIRRYEELTALRETFYEDDAALEKAEARSFLLTLFEELNRILGPRWGVIDTTYPTKAGRTRLAFKRYEDTVRIREIIRLLREHSARSRFPWVFDILVEPHGDMSYELEQLEELEAKAKAPEGHWASEYYEEEFVLRDSEEQRRQREEKFQILEREHLYNLQQQQGEPVDPNLIPLPDEEEDDEDEIDEEDPDETEEPLSDPVSDEDEASGGVAIAPPPPAPPGTESLSQQLEYYVTLFEDCLMVNEGWSESARYGLGEAPVEWSESS
ncbi:MAG TPA: hypothetical protein VGF73_06600 [Chthoniobacterales bacterium]